MKITYYHNDETVVIDVDPEWGELVVSMHKAEHYDNLSRRKNCYSMDALEYEGAEYGKEDPGITSFGEDDPETIAQDELKRLDQGMAALNENQREIVYHHVVEGKTFDAIAAEKGVSKTAVYTSYMRALKKIRSFFNSDR